MAEGERCRREPPDGVLDPFAQNFTATFLTSPKKEWCQREARLLKKPPILSSTAAAAGLSFNAFGISFARPVWDFQSPVASAIANTILNSSSRKTNHAAVHTVLQQDFVNWRPGRARAACASGLASCEDRQLLAELEENGVVQVPWGLRNQLPAATLDEAPEAHKYLNATEPAPHTSGIRHMTCPERLGTSRSADRGGRAALATAFCSQLRHLADVAVPRMLALAKGYMGEAASYSGHRIMRTPARIRPSPSYTSGDFHHDRCGRRVKCFVFWSTVTPTSHPPRVALGTHNTLYYTYDDLKESRFHETHVEAQYNVTALFGRPGDGFCFDTNTIHRGTMKGSKHRDVLVFEFDHRPQRIGCPTIGGLKKV